MAQMIFSKFHSMTEEEHRAWDIVLKCIGIVGALSSFIWGIYQYVDTQESIIHAESIARDRAFAEELFKHRLADFQAIAFAAGKLSAPSEQPGQLDSDIKQFERLYWSSLATLESDSVIKAMDYLRSGIENFQQKQSMLGDTKPEDQLKIRARALTKAIRTAIENEREKLALVNK